MNNRFLIGGVIGSVASFLLGYLIYGLALGSTLDAHTMAGVSRGMEMDWMFLIIGNIAFGFALAYILTKSNASGFGAGATMGAVVGLLIGLGFDSIMYATTNVMTDTTGLFVDVLAFTVMFALVGGVIGAYLGGGAKPAARV